MATNEFNDKSMNFRRLKRVLLEIMFQGEGEREFPWELDPEGGDTVAPEDGPLEFPAGNIWFDDPSKTIRFTYQPYTVAEPGLPTDPNGNLTTFYVARKVVVSMASGSQTYRIEHDLPQFFPVVQVYMTNVVNTWFLYDPLQNGGSVEQDIDTFGGLGGDIVIDMGATTTYNAVAVLVG